MSGVDAGGKIVSVLMSYQITSPLALKNQGKANHQPCAVEDHHAPPIMGYFTFPYFYTAYFNHLKIVLFVMRNRYRDTGDKPANRYLQF